MNLRLKDIEFPNSKAALSEFRDGLLLINTINAHSYNVAQKDKVFAEALINGGILIPDGAGIVWAVRWLQGKKINRIAGWDLFGKWNDWRLPPNPLKGR
jgi:N-acetylglucosaminyldiphosphoundecaprenol N-acetyl-beta-D-mannosaminyltransferase